MIANRLNENSMYAPFDQIEKQYKVYSINELWINRTLDPKSPFITNHNSEDAFVNKFLESSHKWKIANPDASVNIWYDSKFVTKEQIEATQKILDEKSAQDPTWNITLKDIREIDIVHNNPDAFSDRIPIYERVDLVKLIIPLHEIEIEKNEAVIIADIEVGELRPDKDRMTKKELFFIRKLKNIFETYGLMQNYNKRSDWLENQYYQVLNKPETLLALKIYINHMLDCIETALNLKWEIPDEDNKRNKEKALTDLNGMVYVKQSLLFALILSFNDQTGVIEIQEPSGKRVIFDPEKHKIFGNFHDRDACEKQLKNGLMNTSLVELPLYSVEKNVVKARADIKKIVSSIKLPQHIEWKTVDDMNSIFQSFARDCQVRSGRSHFAEIYELNMATTPADGTDIFKVKLITTLPKKDLRPR